MQLLGPNSLAQTGFPGDTGRLRSWARAPRLDALVRRADGDGVRIDHYHRSQGRPDREWLQGTTLSGDSTAPGALAWWRGRLVALVPQRTGVAHLETSGPDGHTWTQPHDLPEVADAVALASGRRLDCLVGTAGTLRHWRFADSGWRPGTVLTRDATSAPALARIGPHLVAVVGSDAGVRGFALSARGGWTPLGVLADAPGAPALAALPGGRALLAVPGTSGVRVWRGRPDAPGPWTPEDALPGLAAHAAVGGLALAATVLAGGADLSRVGLGSANAGGLAWSVGHRTGWVQALVQEEESVFQWHRQPGPRWVRAACLRLVDLDPVTLARTPSAKVAQVTGERDPQPRPGSSGETLSSSESSAGVRGTDLGVRTDIAGTTLLLFGDTHWRRRHLATRDSVARVADPDADRPWVEFHARPLAFRGRGTTMTEYDVPLDAFATHDGWYAFATSNHFRRHQVMGRSVLARALDAPTAVGSRARRPLRFRTLGTTSELYFVNLSCQPLPPTAGLPATDGPPLGLWGSGSYRADDLRFAVLDPAELPRRPRPPLAFFAGLDAGRPAWSPDEPDAVPIVRGAYGEVSVRWSQALGRYLLLAMTGPEDPAGGAVTLRTASAPWGPWSPRIVLFDWIADGLSFADPERRFICALGEDDPVGDRIFGAQAGRPGGAYAPYLYDVRTDARGVRLRYTLSTWNPYQVVLMEHRLGRDELGLAPQRPGADL